MKQILIPTDFSLNAWQAICYAQELFKDQECVFHLLNTYTPAIVSSRFMAQHREEKLHQQGSGNYSEAGLKELVERIQRNGPNPKHYFETYSSFSLLTDEVNNFVEHENIDLIIMGIKGMTDGNHIYMGKNTVRLIKTIKNCPIIAVPRDIDFFQPDEISFSTDFNMFYTHSELEPLIEMAQTFNATIRIVHIQDRIKPLTEIQRFNLGMLRKYLNEIKHYVHTVSEVKSFSNTLMAFNKELDIHLLAMLNYRNSYVDSITQEPMVNKKTFEAQVPLMVIPEMSILYKNPKKKNQNDIRTKQHVN
ncbi:universal stress protein [Cytophaga sp. FL35]|uniref:universal stress protein n=1 Tax=Cytophaga sp. FL35 TaxID=1904456 RepID=UPI001653782D|nr:universal stress protein [Cytophaga sp. FL35]MBC7000301.1 universal stress protein [Cytophaga sp. FL35]